MRLVADVIFCRVFFRATIPFDEKIFLSRATFFFGRRHNWRTRLCTCHLCVRSGHVPRLMAPSAPDGICNSVASSDKGTVGSLLQALPLEIVCHIASHTNVATHAAFARCAQHTYRASRQRSASPHVVLVPNAYAVFGGDAMSISHMAPNHLELCIPCRCFTSCFRRATDDAAFELNMLAFMGRQCRVQSLTMTFVRPPLDYWRGKCVCRPFGAFMRFQPSGPLLPACHRLTLSEPVSLGRTHFHRQYAESH